MALKAFDLVSGARVTPVTAAGWEWMRELSGPGLMKVDLTAAKSVDAENLLDNTRSWRTVIVDSEWVDDGAGGRMEVCRGSGIVFQRTLTADSGTLTCCGFGDLFARLLVINAGLKDQSIAQRVLDPDAEDVVVPAGWRTRISGSTGDMLIELVELALQWQSLPIILPAKTGGTQYREYYSVDVATVADRIDDLSAIIGGAEWSWQPRIIGGRLYHEMLVGTPELVPQTHRLDATLPGVPVSEVSYEEDATDMATDAWATGGKQDDQILVARSHVPTLEELGWPRLMSTVTDHGSVSEISTLMDHAKAATKVGSKPSEVYTFSVRRDYANVQPGDWIDLKWKSWFTPVPKRSKVKVLQTSGTEGDWIKVSTRERI